jgi:hypothetical protein
MRTRLLTLAVAVVSMVVLLPLVSTVRRVREENDALIRAIEAADTPRITSWFRTYAEERSVGDLSLLLKSAVEQFVTIDEQGGTGPMYRTSGDAEPVLIEIVSSCPPTRHSALYPLLFTASELGYAGVVSELLLLGLNVDARSGSGKTALMYAAEQGQNDVTLILISGGASPWLETQQLGDSRPSNALALAQRFGSMDASSADRRKQAIGVLKRAMERKRSVGPEVSGSGRTLGGSRR